MNVQNNFGNTALQYAVRTKNNVSIIKLLIEKGADMNIKDNNG